MRWQGALVLRPEPGNTRTAERLTALGVAVQRCPLFAVAPVPWTPPGPARYDALLLTSANAVRHAGPGLRSLAHLPVLAVGAATADAARVAGLYVALTGASDVAELLDAAREQGFSHPVHLAGRERMAATVDAVTVYSSDPLWVSAETVQSWADHVALLHSPRAARRFAELVGTDRARIAVAALSAAVADAAGEGWAARVAAERPDDACLVNQAAALIDQYRRPADKQGQ